MRKITLTAATAVAILALGACNKEPSGPKSGEQVAAEAAKIDTPQPGKYRTAMKITNVSIPGLPAGQAERMKGMFGAAGHTVEFCLTPEEAGKGFENFSKRAAEGNCTYESFNAGGGTLDARMTCQTGKGMTSKSELHGSYSPTGSKLTMKTDSQMPGMPGGAMHIEAEVVNERIGDCS